MRLMEMAGFSDGSAFQIGRAGWLIRIVWGAPAGAAVALAALGFFALLVDWADLMALSWRTVMGVGSLFGMLAGAVYRGADR